MPESSPAIGQLAVRELIVRAGSFAVGPVSLDVQADRVLVVLGPSGAGKTTLLSAIAGLHPSVAGRVHLAGQDVTAWPPERRRIGLVFQDGALFPHLTVRENIRFGPRAVRRQDVAATDRLIASLGITELADRAPRTLSGGERQRVALARALAIQPRLLLLDEPLSALDQPTREDLRGQLRSILSQQAIPSIHVTHDRDEALTLADDLAIIADGTIRQVGSADFVAANPADAIAARLLGWTELGPGQPDGNRVRIGDIMLAVEDRATGPGPGPARVFYRPEDILLQRADESAGSPGSIRARVQHIDRTRPLARVSLAGVPAINVLALHRDLRLHSLEPGTEVFATLPPHAIRVFPAEPAEPAGSAEPADPAAT